MTRRSPDEVYASLIAAGFPRDAATTMTAVAGAESGWKNDSLGDLGLQDATWGPSYGLFQIRTYRSQTGSGAWRDINWLSASDLHQAQAAWHISSQGTNFTPWTAFTNGNYRNHMAAARAAADRVSGKAGAGDGAVVIDNGAPSWWPDWLPWGTSPVAVGVAGANAASEAATAYTETVAGWLGGARHIALEAAAGVAAAALVVGGLVMWTRRGRQ